MFFRSVYRAIMRNVNGLDDAVVEEGGGGRGVGRNSVLSYVSGRYSMEGWERAEEKICWA